MLKQTVIMITLFLFLSVIALAQDKPETVKKEKQECMKDSKSCCANHEMHSDMKTDSMDSSSVVREGEVDLKAIDQNKDGMVYQDQMCWNVISDKAGECPLCGMKLKEVSILKAKENLIKHDFKVK